MDTRLNYLCTALFWLYIIAALVFTALVVRTVVSIPNRSHVDRKQNKRDIIIFSALASTSFATLSYNMLGFLVDSFALWSRKPRLSLADLRLHDILQWSIESTPFQDFATALIETPGRKVWTESFVLASMFASVFMGSEGYQQRVPRLWAFFGLAQILPVSFAQNLFYVALLKSPGREFGQKSPSNAGWHFLSIQLSGIIAVDTQGERLLWPIVVSTRFILLLPLLTGSPPQEDESPKKRMYDSSGLQPIIYLLIFQIFGIALLAAVEDWDAPRRLALAPFDHAAVRSLGCDVILCAFSYATWTLIPKSPEPANPAAEEKNELVKV